MKASIGRFVAAVGVIVLVGFGAAAAHAKVVPMDLPELADRCEHAVVGTVVAVESYWNEDQTRILTDVQLAVEQDFKGNLSSPDGILVLTELGGTVGEDTMLVTHAPQFNVGERVLVFTERVPDGRLIVLGRDQSKFTLTPAPGIELDIDGRVLSAGASAGSVGYFQPGSALIAQVEQMMLDRGYTAASREVEPAAGGKRERTAFVAATERATAMDWVAEELASWLNRPEHIVVADDAPAESWEQRTGMYSRYDARRWSARGVYHPYLPEDEDFACRTRHSKTFRNADGTNTAFFLPDLHYQDDEGHWRDVDLTLTPNTSGRNPEYDLCNLTNDFRIYVDSVGDHGVVFEFGEQALNVLCFRRTAVNRAGKTGLQFAKRNGAPGTLTDRRVVTFGDAYPGMSEELVMLKGGIEYGVSIRSADWLADAVGGDLVFVHEIVVPPGWSVVADGQPVHTGFSAGEFALLSPDASDGVRYRPVVVYDGRISRDTILKNAEIPPLPMPAVEPKAGGPERREADTYHGRYVGNLLGDRLLLAYTVPVDWLRDPERVFPVYIDPTVEILTGYGQSSQTNSGMPYNTYYHDQRYDFLVLASELTAAGVTGGSTITGMSMFCSATAGMNLSNFRIRTQATSATTMTAWVTAGWTLNFGPYTHATPTEGTWYDYTFATNYSFDGTSNLLVNVSRDNTGWSGSGGNYCRGTISSRAGYGFSDSGYTWPYDGMGFNAFSYLPSMKITYTPPAEHCYTPPTYDYTITPTTSWQATATESVGATGCRIYRVFLCPSFGYDFSTCVNDGVGGSAPTGDSDFRMYDATGAQLWYIDGPSSCGYDATTLGSAYQNWVPPAAGYYYLKVSEYYNSALTYTLAYQCTAIDPCANTALIGGCGAGYTQNYTSACAGSWNVTACGYSTYGQEKVYSFVAPSTGTYSIQVTAGGCWVDYFWRAASCSSTGWNCIQDIYSPGTYGAMSWTVGTTYYILLDAEGTSSCTHQFYINCPAAGPSISGVSPDHAPAGVGSAGPAGSLVTVTGTGFGATKQSTDHMVFWGSGSNYYYNDSYIVSWTDTQIQCYVPAGCSSKDCAVYKNGVWSNFATFTVDWSFWYRWQDQSWMPLEYYINQNGCADISGDGEFGAVRASLQTWENVANTYLDHSYRGTTALTATNNDGYNVISWTNSGWSHGAGVIGVSTIWLSGGNIIETDQEYNDQEFTFTLNGLVAGQVDVQNVVTHESGHGLCGLSDLYGVPDQNKTMFGTLDVASGEDKKRTLEPEDIAGCQWLYPQTGAFAHDACASAIQISSLPAYVSGKNSPPYATDDYTGSTCDGPYKNLWWRVTGTGQELVATTCSANTTFDTELAVYDGCGGNQMACNDDDYSCSWSGVHSTVRWCSTYGQTYYISVGSYYSSSTTGSFELYVYEGEITPATPTGAYASPLSRVCTGGSTQLGCTAPGAGAVDWYAGSCGGTYIGTGNPLTVNNITATTTYYARARNTTSGCYSPGCTSITITVGGAGPACVAHGPDWGCSDPDCCHIVCEMDPYCCNNEWDSICADEAQQYCTALLPAAPTNAVASPDAVCPGAATSLSCSAAGALVDWYTGGCGSSYVGTGNPLTVYPSTATTYYARARDPSSECASTGCASVAVSMKTLSGDPSGANAGPQAICPGESSTLSVAGGSLGTGASWVWYAGSCGGTYVGSGASLLVWPGSTTTYYVRAEGDCNATNCASVTVTVLTSSTAPTGAAANPAAICAGDSSTLGVQGGALGSGASWVWYSGSCGGTYVGTGASIGVSPGTTTTYYVRAEGTCNTTACASTTVTVVPLPVAPTSAGIDRDWFCPGDAGTIALTASGGSGDTLYWYTGGCGGTYLGAGSPLVIDSPAATTTYYVRRENACGVTSCITVTAHVDTTGPSFASIPSNVTINADAGYCHATDVNIGQATATDDHNGVSGIVATRSDSLPLSDPYPVGTTTITWTAADGCGSETQDSTQTVTVQPYNELLVDVQLRGVSTPSLVRCVTFVLYDCSGDTKIVEELVTFTGGLAANVPLLVDCGDYDCVLAQDDLHTLVRRLDRGAGLEVANRKYVASFTGAGADLINGDLYDDNLVDIVDFGVYIAGWGTNPGAVTCATPPPHADINGDYAVDVTDFNYISGNFLAIGDGDCCVLALGEPRTSVTVQELRQMGLGYAARGDLNYDGVIDLTDVELFLSGVVPPDLKEVEPADVAPGAGPGQRRAE